MKKILTLIGIFALSISAYAACPIDKLESCTAEINSGFSNTDLKDKIIPNRMNELNKPNNTFNNRDTQGQSHTPQNLNMEPIQKENTQPYNANCQFGNCLNRTNNGADNNK